MSHHEQKTTRRDVMKAAAVATGAIAATPYFPWSEKAFANQDKNDRPNIGCIGVGSMGSGDARGHANFGNIVAVCDVDERHALRAKNDDRIGKGVADAYGDYRKVLDRKDIDAVSIVTPDHWHIKIAVEALEAGKHVFVQKPLTLTLEENQLIRRACEKHSNLAFLVGTQQRSDRNKFMRAVNMVQKGLLGKIKHVTVGINGSPTGGPFPVAEVPKELNWEMWQGQAPLQEYRARRCHYEFRWWYEYSGGKLTDWGAHHVDIANWALKSNGQTEGPISISGEATHPVEFKAGYPVQRDRYNTATNFAFTVKYPGDVEMIIKSEGRNGVLIEGEKGRIFVSRRTLDGSPVKALEQNPLPEDAIQNAYKGLPMEQNERRAHWANFLYCHREQKEPISDVHSHMQMLNVCHLAGISARLGRSLKWDDKNEQVVGDDLANSFLARPYRKGFEINM